MLTRLALGGISGKYGIKPRDDCGVIDVFGIELGKARAVECRTEIKVVPSRPLLDEADLGEIGPRAAVGGSRSCE